METTEDTQPNKSSIPTLHTTNLKNFTPLCQVIPSRRFWSPVRLKTDLVLHVLDWKDTDKNTVCTIIPEYFYTDGASVPWPFRLIFPQLGRYLAAAFIHDYYCVAASRMRSEYLRTYADRNFYTLCRLCGVGILRAGIMAIAVRVYGRVKILLGKYN